MQDDVLDHFCKAEAAKMSWFREHQGQLGASDYRQLQELLGDSGITKYEGSVVRSSRLLLLLSTRVGEEREMRQ